MATGILGTADLSAGANTTLYTCPADTFTIATVGFVNRGTTAATVRLSVSDTATPSNAEYLEYEATILPNNVLERTGIAMQADKILVVRSSSANVNALAMGIETSSV
tara:strand:+ start:12246 stop:12566 length:321 start_codon:yes stop_codon:yes gene_type:complete